MEPLLLFVFFIIIAFLCYMYYPSETTAQGEAFYGRGEFEELGDDMSMED
jgi:hypothetical protein